MVGKGEDMAYLESESISKQFFTDEEIEIIEDALEEAIYSLMEEASWQTEKRAKQCTKEIEKYRNILEKIRNKSKKEAE